MQFAVYISETHVTMKHSQGHETYNDNVDLKQGCNQAKFERVYFNSLMVSEKKPTLNFFSNKEIYHVTYLPWTCAKIKHNGKSIHDLLDILNKTSI